MKNIAYSMSRSLSLSLILATGVILFGGCASAPNSAPPAGAAAGRLVITRSFALRGVPIAIVINGTRVATLTYNRTYEGPISAGSHTLNLERASGSGSGGSAAVHLVVQAGETYRFTATREGQNLVLEHD